jgi:hypothetical protein
MEKQDILYQDNHFKIGYHPDIVDAHFLTINKRGYVLDHNILEDLARSSIGKMEEKVHAYNEMILYQANKEGIGLEGLHKALSQAFAEHEKRVQKFIKKQKN